MKKYLAFLAILWSCGHVQRVDNEAIRETIKRKQPKQISKAKFDAIAADWGSKIMAVMENCPAKSIDKLAQDPRVVKALHDTGATFSSLTQIQAKTPKERQIIEALNFDHSQQISGLVQDLGDGRLMYVCQLKSLPQEPVIIYFTKGGISQHISVKELAQY